MDLARGRFTIGEVMDYVHDLLALDSSTARAVADGPVWQVEHYLAADLFAALTGKPHPGRPKRSALRAETDPAFHARRERARARARARAAQIAAGEIT